MRFIISFTPQWIFSLFWLFLCVCVCVKIIGILGHAGADLASAWPKPNWLQKFRQLVYSGQSAFFSHNLAQHDEIFHLVMQSEDSATPCRIKIFVNFRRQFWLSWCNPSSLTRFCRVHNPVFQDETKRLVLKQRVTQTHFFFSEIHHLIVNNHWHNKFRTIVYI